MTEQRGLVRTEPSHKRVRIAFGGDVIVDTDDALYVWEIPYYPQYYIPLGDVADGVLHPSATQTRSPSRGTADHSTVRVGDREAPDAAWRYPDSPIEALRERVRFDWGAMDAWFEEDEEIFVHPRDPSTRVHILPSSRHVTITIDGVLVADTTSRRSSTRPTCRGARTSPSSTCGWTCWCRRPAARCARTRARRAYWSLATGRRAHRHRVELPGAIPRVGTDRRADGVLRRPGRRHRGRRAPGVPARSGDVRHDVKQVAP